MNLEGENKTSEIGTDNIFEEIASNFESDLDSNEETQEMPPEIKKLDIIAKVLLASLITFSVIVVFMFSYIWFQNSEVRNTFLPSSVCWVFSGDANVDNSKGCSSVTALNKDYEQKLNTEKFEILDKTLKLIPDTYEVEDFMNSKEVIFLLDKTKNKVRPLEILEAFDDIKNKFSSIWKSDVECQNIIINDNEEIEVDCVIYSYDWQSDINWTSQSLAALFQLEFEKSNDFLLLEKQRKFSSSPVFDKPLVSRKTDLHLRLKYEGWDTINF